MFVFLWQASDGTHNTTTPVRVTVRDSNNHSPLFSRQLYLGVVQETASPGEFCKLLFFQIFFQFNIIVFKITI